MKCKLLTVLMVVAFVAQGAWADDGSLSVATGFDYSSGKYGTANTTNILSIPVVGKYETGLWTLKLTLPYLRISGASGVVPGLGRLGPTTTNTTTQSGLGDMVAAVTYNISEGSVSTPAIDLIGKVKLATADTGLGTGQNDYAAQVDVDQSFDKFTPMASLGYKVRGSPAGIAMNKVAYGYLGVAYQITDQTSGGVAVDLSQRSSAASAGQRELTVYVNHKIDKNLKVQGYLLQGFSNGSPDRGIGAMVSSKF